ncbi:hypothetical protein BVU17_15340 [Haloarcula taiwanensis]|uniref:Uncharacterized protein n=1 Tax=Haloarcula taiwanensis TaxID=1932004 RepID=A0A2H5A2S0_9EURY|nr:hypothetical protein [Haloarcula sp. Atlit-120R]AUG48970.1 hypothetical protein BVU17_15340 [Haloarcula taiwanensis]
MNTVRRKQAHRDAAPSIAVSGSGSGPDTGRALVTDLIVDNIRNALVIEQALRFGYGISETIPRTELAGVQLLCGGLRLKEVDDRALVLGAAAVEPVRVDSG